MQLCKGSSHAGTKAYVLDGRKVQNTGTGLIALSQDLSRVGWGLVLKQRIFFKTPPVVSGLTLDQISSI